MSLSKASEVLQFWYGDEYSTTDNSKLRSMDYYRQRLPYWFYSAHAAFNEAQIANRALLDDLKALDYTSFCGKASKEELSLQDLLAIVIVFDQFPRTIFRGTAQAFAFDGLALEHSKLAIARTEEFNQLTAIERLFFEMPLTHSESLEEQLLGVHLGHCIAANETEDIQQFFKNLPGFPEEHCDVIKRFGRFPSRNIALNRENTAEEEEWLNSPDCPGWAKSQYIKK